MSLTDDPVFASVEGAIDEIRAGRMVIVVDDEDRENEGDLIMAAEKATPQAINFLARFARGLICAPMLEDRLGASAVDCTKKLPGELAIQGFRRCWVPRKQVKERDAIEGDDIQLFDGDASAAPGASVDRLTLTEHARSDDDSDGTSPDLLGLGVFDLQCTSQDEMKAIRCIT